MLRRRREAGQHLSEYAMVMGVVAMAAIGVQVLARRAIHRGLQSASNAVLVPYVRPGCLDTDGDGVCNCDDSNRDGACDAATSDSTQTATETGLGGGQRRLALTESVTGQAEGVNVRLKQVQLDNIAVPRLPGRAIPRPEPPPRGRRPRPD